MGVTTAYVRMLMSRGLKSDRPVKLHLSMPQELADWIEEGMNKNVYCHTRQDFIVGKLTEIMQEETSKQGLLEEVE